TMAGRKVLAITERQFGVLRALWEHGPLTVRGLMEHLPRGDRQPYTTVLGLLQAMEKAGLADHEKRGLSPLYRPAGPPPEATGSVLCDFLSKFFHGSAEQLILGLVDAEALAPEELRAIEVRLAGARGEGGLGAGDADPRAGARRKKEAP